jgi:hypothetical protein
VLPAPMSIDTEMGAAVLNVGMHAPWVSGLLFEVGGR